MVDVIVHSLCEESNMWFWVFSINGQVSSCLVNDRCFWAIKNDLKCASLISLLSHLSNRLNFNVMTFQVIAHVHLIFWFSLNWLTRCGKHERQSVRISIGLILEKRIFSVLCLLFLFVSLILTEMGEQWLPELLFPLHKVIFSAVSFLVSLSQFVQKSSTHLTHVFVAEHSHLIKFFIGSIPKTHHSILHFFQVLLTITSGRLFDPLVESLCVVWWLSNVVRG